MLRRHDVGLALLFTPHPSLVPLEMAAAGMLSVTNTYENKTSASLVDLSENLIPVAPTVADVKRGLGEAAVAVENIERRSRGSQVRWSTTWDRSLSPDVMDRIRQFLEP
jgi:hypothetical protein